MSPPNRSLSYTNKPTLKRTSISGQHDRIVILPPQEVPPTKAQLVSLFEEITQTDLRVEDISSSDIMEDLNVLDDKDIIEEHILVQDAWLEEICKDPFPVDMVAPVVHMERHWGDDEPTQDHSAPCIPMLFYKGKASTDLDLVPSFAWSKIGYKMLGDEQYVAQIYIQNKLYQSWRVRDGFIAAPLIEE